MYITNDKKIFFLHYYIYLILWWCTITIAMMSSMFFDLASTIALDSHGLDFKSDVTVCREYFEDGAFGSCHWQTSRCL